MSVVFRDLRAALLGVRAPASPDTDIPQALAVVGSAAEDIALALDVARRTNDPDSLPEIAVEAIVADEGLEAAAKVLERHFATVKREARDRSQALRHALGAELAAIGRRRVEASAHSAALEGGAERVVIDWAVEDIPDEYVVTTRRPNLSKVGEELARRRHLPFAHLERGPPRVRITLIEARVRRKP